MEGKASFNKILGVILQVGSGKGNVNVALPLPCEGREVIFYGPSDYVNPY